MSTLRSSIRFWPHRSEAKVASTRIRCLRVIDALRTQGVDAAQYTPGDAPGVLVLSKRYDEASRQTALELQRRYGTRLVLDLCDNLFHVPAGQESWHAAVRQLEATCVAVDCVVTPTRELAEIVQAEVPGLHSVSVVPDGLDVIASPADLQRPGEWFARGRLAVFDWQRRHVPPGRRLIWFGSHGNVWGQGGIDELARLAPALNRHAREAPLSMLVVSNSAARWRAMAAKFEFACAYLKWSPAVCAAALQRSDIVVIPTEINAVTRGKSANRLATAFMQGVAVASDPLPSYLPFADVAPMADWDDGLRRLMADAAERERRVQVAQQRLRALYDMPVIARAWQVEVERLLRAPLAQAA